MREQPGLGSMSLSLETLLILGCIHLDEEDKKG